MSSIEPVNMIPGPGSDNSVTGPPLFEFLKLPKEIRVEIYRYLLSSKYIKRKSPYYEDVFLTTYYTYPFHKEILRTNRKIYQEAVYIFHKENLFVSFTTNHTSVQDFLWRSQDFLFLTLGDYSSSFRRCAMEISHSCPGQQITSETCLLVSDQLPNLLRTLRACSQQDIQQLAGSSFSVNILDAGDWSAQTQLGLSSIPTHLCNLLEPFKILYAVESLTIKGMVNAEYKQVIVSYATRPEPTTADILTAASETRMEGNDAFDKQQYDLALSLYTSAMRDFQVNHFWVEYTGDMEYGEFAGWFTPHAAKALQFRLYTDLATVSFKVGEYENAKDHAKACLLKAHIHDWPLRGWGELHMSETEVAIPFFWGGMAFERLGDFNRALYGVGEAVFRHPENKSFVQEYNRLEVEMMKRGIEPTSHEFGKGTNWWVG